MQILTGSYVVSKVVYPVVRGARGPVGSRQYIRFGVRLVDF